MDEHASIGVERRPVAQIVATDARSPPTASSTSIIGSERPAPCAIDVPSPSVGSSDIQIVENPYTKPTNELNQPTSSTSSKPTLQLSHPLPPPSGPGPLPSQVTALEPTKLQVPCPAPIQQTDQVASKTIIPRGTPVAVVPVATPGQVVATSTPPISLYGAPKGEDSGSKASTSWDALKPYLGSKFAGKPPPNTQYQFLYNLPVIRAVQPNPTRFSELEPFRILYYIQVNGGLVHATGDVATQPCRSCINGFRLFQGCIIPPAAARASVPGGACSNCVGSGRAGMCDFASQRQKTPKQPSNANSHNTLEHKASLNSRVKTWQKSRTPRGVGLKAATENDGISPVEKQKWRRIPGGCGLAFMEKITPEKAKKELPQPLLDPQWFGDRGDTLISKKHEPRPPKGEPHAGEKLLSLRVKQLGEMNKAELAQIKMEMSIWEAAFSVVEAENESVNIGQIAKTREWTEKRLRKAESRDTQVIAETDVNGYDSDDVMDEY